MTEWHFSENKKALCVLVAKCQFKSMLFDWTEKVIHEAKTLLGRNTWSGKFEIGNTSHKINSQSKSWSSQSPDPDPSPESSSSFPKVFAVCEQSNSI